MNAPEPPVNRTRRARTVAGRIRRRVTGGPSKRTLRANLAASRAKLKQTRADLEQTRAELAETKSTLDQARVEQDKRKLGDTVEESIVRVRGEHLTFLRPPALRDLAAATLDLERNHIPGLIIETGTALGGSAIVLAAAKGVERPMKVYDVFGMIPEPSERDGEDVQRRYEKILKGEAKGRAGETYYGYRDDLYEEVTASFARLSVPVDAHNIELVKGLFEDTIHLDEPVALAHLDGDWYESTMTCLERIVPLLVPGGRIVLDDYEMWSGCRTAVDEYFANADGFRFEQHNRLHVVRA